MTGVVVTWVKTGTALTLDRFYLRMKTHTIVLLETDEISVYVLGSSGMHRLNEPFGKYIMQIHITWPHPCWRGDRELNEAWSAANKLVLAENTQLDIPPSPDYFCDEDICDIRAIYIYPWIYTTQRFLELFLDQRLMPVICLYSVTCFS